MAAVAEDDVSDAALPYFGARRAVVAGVPVTLLRVSYVGEHGWEIYATADNGRRLWDALWQAGQPHGMIAAGRAAFGALRMEKGYRAWGTDMTTEHTPFEAGLGFATRGGAEGHVGHDALEKARDAAPRRRLRTLLLPRHGTVVLGKEPVSRDGEPVGYVTSAAYGHTVGAGLAYAWLPADVSTGDELRIGYFDTRVPAIVTDDALYDPKGARMRGRQGEA
jgi:glycine cleavage system aminomethyltransferase T